MTSKPRKRKCKVKSCRQEFFPITSFQKWCCIECAIIIAKEKREKDIARGKSLDRERAKAQRKIDRQNKEKLKTLPQWIKEVQKEFNAFIRLRDYSKPCISCDMLDYEIEDRFCGGKWDAGHFLSRGSRPELRFDEDNCHKQCKSCNSPGPRKAVKVQQQYEVNIVARIGQERVDRLKGHHQTKRWTVEDLQEMKIHYREESKKLKKEIGDIIE